MSQSRLNVRQKKSPYQALGLKASTQPNQKPVRMNRMAENNKSRDPNKIVSVLFRLAVKYPELAIITSVMLLLLLPITILSQIYYGYGLILFLMYFLFSVVAMVILYATKGFISAIAHSPSLKTVSSWCVVFTVLSITISLGISVSMLLLSLVFPKFENKFISDVSELALTTLVKRDAPNPAYEQSLEQSSIPYREVLPMETKSEAPEPDQKEQKEQKTTPQYLSIENNDYKNCLSNARSKSDIESCIDDLK
jgi:hypothetical protein